MVGNLGGNPEFRGFENGDEICTFSVASNKRWMNKKSQKCGEVIHWHQVVVRNSKHLALCQSHLKKVPKYTLGILRKSPLAHKQRIDELYV